MPIWTVLLLTGSFLFFGILFLRAGWSDLMRARASRNWPSTFGKITWVKERTHRTKGGRIALEYVAKYEYTVAGKTHEGRWNSLASTRVKRGVHPYSVQQDVNVYFAPEDPSISRLEQGVKFRDLFLPMGGAAFILAVSGGIFVYLLLA